MKVDPSEGGRIALTGGKRVGTCQAWKGLLTVNRRMDALGIFKGGSEFARPPFLSAGKCQNAIFVLILNLSADEREEREREGTRREGRREDKERA